MTLRQRVLAAGAIGVAALGMTGLTAGSASAAPQSGCVWNAACLYYSPGLAGSASSWTGAEDNYASQNFLSSGAGQGQNVWHNAASGWNTNGTLHLRVYVNTSWNGYSQVMNILYSSTDSINFNTTLRNQNESHKFTLS